MGANNEENGSLDIDALLTLQPRIVDIVEQPDGWYVLETTTEPMALPGDVSDPLGPAGCLPVAWRPPTLQGILEWKGIPPATMFKEVSEYLARYSEMPIPEYVDLLAAWVFLTYVHRWFHFSPQILLYAEQERGKSRTGKALVWASFRGWPTETVNEAPMFRLAQTGFTIFVDVTDFTGKAKGRGSVDVFGSRFERGIAVARVNRPEMKGPSGVDLYELFGPTIIATNRPISGVQQSRGFMITPPQSRQLFDEPPTPEAGLPIREMLTAWRGQMLLERPALPALQGYKTGRFRDISRPLRQIAQMVAPDRLAAVDAALAHLWKSRQQLRAEGEEANVLLAIGQAAHGDADGGFVTTESVRKAYEDMLQPRSGEWQPSLKWIGGHLAAMGFDRANKCVRGVRQRGIMLDRGLLADLEAKYLEDGG